MSSQSSGSPRTVTTELGEKVESWKKVKQSANCTALIQQASQDELDTGRDDENLPERLQGQFVAKVQAFRMKTNFQIACEAYQQVKKMLPAGMKDGDIIALQLLFALKRTPMALVSCTTEVQDFPKSGDWEEKEKEAFCRKYTSLVPGVCRMGRILDSWEKVFKYLVDEIRWWPSEGCCTNVFKEHSDNLDYKNYLGVELHKNKHKIVEWEKITKTETYEIKSLESLGWKIFNQYEEQTGAMSNYREEHQQQRPRTIHDDKDSDVSGWFSHSKVSNKEGEFDEETTKLGEKENYTALTLRASQGKPNSGRGEDNLLEGQRQDALQVKERFHMLHKSRQLELGMLEGGSSKTVAGVVMENAVKRLQVLSDTYAEVASFSTLIQTLPKEPTVFNLPKQISTNLEIQYRSPKPLESTLSAASQSYLTTPKESFSNLDSMRLREHPNRQQGHMDHSRTIEIIPGLMGVGSGLSSELRGSSNGSEEKQRKKRVYLPKKGIEKLRAWLLKHPNHPYPTKQQKETLAGEAGITIAQVSNWFRNARKSTTRSEIPAAGPFGSRQVHHGDKHCRHLDLDEA